jgi:hypothetical protein
MALIDSAEAQDTAIAPTAALQLCLRHHTVVSHRIDPTGECIENLKQNKKIDLDQGLIWMGWPANRSRLDPKKQKRGHVNYLDLLNLDFAEKKSLKKK